MSCGKETNKTDHGHDVTGSPLKCGTPIYYTENQGGKVSRTEVILCHACYKAAQALEEATRP